jgi:hypothetical protein
VITLLGLGSLYLFGGLPLPGIDRQRLDQLEPGAGDVPVVGALGIMPFVTAFLLVEVAVALWVLVSGRHEPGPRGRRWMLACAFGLALVTSVVNGWGIARFYEHLDALASWPAAVLTLSAATMATGLVLIAISRWGMGNGFSLAVLASVILQVRGRIADLRAPQRDWADVPSIPLTVLGGGVLLAACVVLLRAREGRKLHVSVPLLAAGAVPLVVAGYVPPLFHMTGVEGGWAMYGAQAAVILVSAVLLSWLFRLPARVRREVPQSDGEGLAQRLVIMGIGSALVLFTLYLGAGVIERTPGFFLSVAVADLLVAVAVCLDLADRVAFRWRHGLRRVVEVAVLHTVFEADAASRRLTEAGIDHHVQGLRHRSAMYVLAAYAEMRVLVPEADLVRARMALRPERGAGVDTGAVRDDVLD